MDTFSRATLGSIDEVLHALTGHTPVGIFMSNADGACEYVNERWCELTGLTVEAAIAPSSTSAK